MLFASDRKSRRLILARTGAASIGFFALVAGWILLVSAGLYFSFAYQFTSAETTTCNRWPEKCGIELSLEKPTLVLFIHPQCPCTHASLIELSEIVEREPGRISTYVVSYLPNASCLSWQDTRITQAAAAIKEVQLIFDPNGRIAKRFHASASGQSFLFSTDGNIQFQGGITSSRGHRGSNPGSRAIFNLVEGSDTDCSWTPVYGCPLFAPDSSSEMETQ